MSMGRLSRVASGTPPCGAHRSMPCGRRRCATAPLSAGRHTVAHMVPALSPSRASDFKQCPLLYRFRAVDKLPSPPSPAAARGTLVHAVLERLFDLPATERTPEAARSLLGPQW